MSGYPAEKNQWARNDKKIRYQIDGSWNFQIKQSLKLH